MSAFSAMFDVLFADANMAKEAAYAPAAGGLFSVQVMTRAAAAMESPFGMSVVSPSLLADLRRSDVAAPVVGDRLTIDGVVYMVNAAPRAEADGLIWTLELVEPDA